MTELWEIKQQNQWWDNPESIREDIKITSFEDSAIKWYPDTYSEIEFGPPKIYVIKGVRQIGKSTLLKLLIRKLLKEGANPRAIFYFSFDNLSDYKEIPKLIKTYLDLVESSKLEMYYLFFDEVTLVKNWQQGIKYAADIGLLKNSTLIISGSSAVDLKHSSERLPGRRAGGKELNKLLLPMSFNEFLKFKGMEIEKIDITDLFKIKIQKFNELKIKLPDIQKYFAEYILNGGIPAVINNTIKMAGRKSGEIETTYSDVFFSTMGKLNRNRTILLQIVRRLVQLNFSGFSWQSFTSETDIGSFHTVQEYLRYMADSYFIGLVYFLDSNKKTIRPKKEKKAYVTDPTFLRLFLKLSGIDPDQYLVRDELLGLYLENITYSHLIRFFRDEAFEGLADLQGISYWRSERQREVDFIIHESKNILPIELKYQRQINTGDYLTMKKVFNNGLVLTRDAFFSDEGIHGIPLPIFIACVP